MKHDNDNKPRQTTAAFPLAIRLFRQKRAKDLARLVRYGTVVTVPTWHSANDNLPEVEGEPLVERIVEIRPSPDEMVWLAVQDAIATRAGYGPITAGEMDAPMRQRLRFDAQGQITEWRGSDERWHDAAELWRQQKGSRRKSEAERLDDNERHVSIPGTGGFPERTPYPDCKSDGSDYWKLRHAYMLVAMTSCNDNRRQDVDRLGVGSRYTFEQAWRNAGLSPASRIPRYMTAIAPGTEFLAYRVHGNPRAMQGGVEGGHDLVERQVIETIDAPRIDAALGEHARVLDMSIAGMTAREIASRLGWGDTKQAERRAVAAQDAALAALSGVEQKMAA